MSTQTVKPATTKLFCKQDEAELVTKSGFVLSESAVDRPMVAEVIDVGDDITDYISEDKIIYKAYATTEINLNGTEYFLIDVEDVLGKIV